MAHQIKMLLLCCLYLTPVSTQYAGSREGFLWKRGRESKQFKQRRFLLSAREGVLKYYTKEVSSQPESVVGSWSTSSLRLCSLPVGNSMNSFVSSNLY